MVYSISTTFLCRIFRRNTYTVIIIMSFADLNNRLLFDNETDRIRLREQFDTCIYIGETLVVECTSTDPNAVLELSGGDGTTYMNGTARIDVSTTTFDAANTTFSCVITNAQGPCGQFMFQSPVRVYGKHD